jgi:hypothetical protein
LPQKQAAAAASKASSKSANGNGSAVAASAGPPGLGQSEKLQELAKAYLAELARGSSSQDLLRKLMCPVVLTAVPHSNGGIVMVGDTGAEVHIVGEKDHEYLMNIRVKDPPCVLDTANGTIHLGEQGDVVCDGILLQSCVFNPYVKFSLASISCLKEDGWVYVQG